MLLVPREFEDCYPFSDYDYPPSKMTREERKEFVRLLTTALKVLESYHQHTIAVLPKHHFSVLSEASKLSGVKIELLPYGRLAFRSIKEASLKALKLSEGL
jgi:predicted RNA-binding protein